MSEEFSTPIECPRAMTGYELLEKIGEGGMGQVHRATQLSLGRTVAIKFLNPRAPALDEGTPLHRESRLMAALAHPHVVTIYDSGHADGRPYLVMEYIDGSTLRSRMESGKPWPIAEAAPVLDAVAQALSYIHEQGILHLDLKPENVLCTSNGSVKITDFGLATSHVDARTLSEQGLTYGSHDYCSPEQRHGLPLDQRSDVFSTAVLAYELLTGQLPSRVYTPASKFNRSLPRAVDDVLRRALERQVEERPTSVEEFRQALLRALGWRKPSAGRRHFALAAGLVVSLCGLGLALLRLSQLGQVEGPRAAQDDSVPYSAAFGGEDFLLYPANRTGNTNLYLLPPQGGPAVKFLENDSEDVFPACSPDGRWIAFASNRSGNRHIFLMNVQGGEIKQLTQGKSWNQTPTWSPDGKRIAFTTDRDGDYEIYVMNLDGSEQVNLTRDPGYDGDPAWSPDGTKIAFASRRQGSENFRVFVMDADGGNPHAVADADTDGYVYPAWSPDGKRLAYSGSGDESIELFVCDADGSHNRRLTHLGGLTSLATWTRDGKRIVFQHTRPGSTVASLYLMNEDGSNLQTILKAVGPRDGGRPTWVPAIWSAQRRAER